MKVVSPIIPMPSWFFTDILTSETKDTARVMWAFISKSLETGQKEIPASFKDIEMWTGLVPDRLSESLKTLREKGYLLRIKQGTIISKTGKREKSVYKVNWDCKESGVENRIRKVYKFINEKYDIAHEPEKTEAEFNIDSNIASLAVKPKPGEKVRVGRFGDETNGRKWFTIGYEGYHQQVANGPWGVMMRKIADGKFDELSSRDIISYFEHRHLQKYNIPYIPIMGKDLNIINKLRKVLDNKQILRIIRYLFDSGQTDFKRPTIGLLGSGYINIINQKTIEWCKLNSKTRRN